MKDVFLVLQAAGTRPRRNRPVNAEGLLGVTPEPIGARLPLPRIHHAHRDPKLRLQLDTLVELPVGLRRSRHDMRLLKGNRRGQQKRSSYHVLNLLTNT